LYFKQFFDTIYETGEKRYKIMFGNCKGRWRRKWEDNIKTDS